MSTTEFPKPNKGVFSHEIGTLDIDILDIPNPSEVDLTDKVVIEAKAFASNPCDFKILRANIFGFPLPFTLGNDVAGVVVKTGSNVTNVKVGDRVVAFTSNFSTLPATNLTPVGSAFQTYPIVPAVSLFKIPNSIPYEKAVVSALTVATAADALFFSQKLDKPVLETAIAEKTKPTSDKKGVFFVYSGGSNLGRQLVQLAAIAGYAVVTTASPKNEKELKELGATSVIDYKQDSATVISKVVDSINKTGLKLVGSADAFSEAESIERSLEILAKLADQGKTVEAKPKISLFGPPPPELAQKYFTKVTFSGELVFTVLSEEKKEFASWFYNFLTNAFANGSFVASPEPLIVGKGLESLKAAFEATEKGLSGKKAVVLVE